MAHLLLPIIYLAFISLGLPDALLGSAWPIMYKQFNVPVSYAGMISMIICIGTIVSSLQSDRITRKLGTGKVTALSVCLTAIALMGFSMSHSFPALCLWAIPYGLGAGSVDASINNYVALHYESHHMSWLHCMWGLGASTGPYIMGYVLTNGMTWNMGYRFIFLLQIVLTAILILSLPLWKRPQEPLEIKETTAPNSPALSLKEIISLPGAKAIMITFFSYCALEQTAGLWASSYLVLKRGLDAQTAAHFGSLFFLGITIGRGINGFISFRLNDRQMIQLGFGLITIGIITLLLPYGYLSALIGLIFVGMGCAPIYPCLLHSTPMFFGPDKSQAVIGVQMASAYVGSAFAPPVFGFIANHIHIGWYPVYLGFILLLMITMYKKLLRNKNM